jgi:hypothetical protein
MVGAISSSYRLATKDDQFSNVDHHPKTLSTTDHYLVLVHDNDLEELPLKRSRHKIRDNGNLKRVDDIKEAHTTSPRRCPNQDDAFAISASVQSQSTLPAPASFAFLLPALPL